MSTPAPSARPSPVRDPRFYQRVAAGVWRGMGKDDCSGLAAAVAYHFIFSFFAGFFFLACVFTQFGSDPNNLRAIVDFLNNFLPPPAIDLVQGNIQRFLKPVVGQALIPALLLSLWTSSNVVEMIMRALNRIYSVAETRPGWQTKLLAMLLVVVTALFLIISFNLGVFSEQIRTLLVRERHWAGPFFSLLPAAQWSLVLLASGAAAAGIYFLAPNFRRGYSRVALPGALFFAVVWQVVNQGFRTYLAHFADFDRIYGPLGTAMAVLMWVYLSALLLLIGGEINAQIVRHLPRKPGRRGRPAEPAAPEAVETINRPAGS